MVVYASDREGEGQLDLWLQRIAGGPPVRLTNDPGTDRDPHFSPDGSFITFRSDRANGGVFVMPAVGGDARLVAEGGCTLRFSPDGTRIAYWAGPWLPGARTAGTGCSRCPQSAGRRCGSRSVSSPRAILCWSPDGRAILFFGVAPIEGSAGRTVVDWWFLPLDGVEPVQTGVYQALAANGLSGANVNNTVAPAPDALPAAWTAAGVIFSARSGQSINLWRVGVASSGHVVDDSLQRLTEGAESDVGPSVDATGRVAFQVETLTTAP